ncbi:hypothetical protein Lal_00012406, partial [Lupinus albus]
ACLLTPIFISETTQLNFPPFQLIISKIICVLKITLAWLLILIYPLQMHIHKQWISFHILGATLMYKLYSLSMIILVLVDNSMDQLVSGNPINTHPTMEKSARMDDADFRSLPGWKSNDVKSWIWMQQAMHPELNYNSGFRKKLVSFIETVHHTTEKCVNKEMVDGNKIEEERRTEIAKSRGACSTFHCRGCSCSCSYCCREFNETCILEIVGGVADDPPSHSLKLTSSN